MEQRSEDWFKARLGKVTASRVSDVMARTKTGYSASRANYMAELICERLTGQPAERFTSAAMQWGTDTEPHAKAAYAFMRDAAIEDVGFVLHSTISDFGASPDGLVGSDGLVEIKCPNTATHIDMLLNDGVEGKYLIQMQVQMACTGRLWCDFVSFDPRLPVDMQLFVKRIKRDEDWISEIEKEVSAFLGEIAKKMDALHNRFSKVAA